MPKRFLRPTTAFTVESVEWDLDIVKRYTDAGFDDIPRDEVILHFWILIDFLQINQLTTHCVVSSLVEMTNETKLTNFDLTDDGYYFLQKYHGRYTNRLRKGDSEQKSRTFPSKWFTEYCSNK